MIDVTDITDLHKQTVRQWHEGEIENRCTGFLAIVCDQHERNFRLWHQEDIARSPDANDKTLGEVKRRIDRLNQQRNDFIERLDDALIDALTRELDSQGIKPGEDVPLNTETPGSAIDRLSILSLRLFHMHEQADREDATETHRQKMQDKLTILYRQHRDLSQSLQELLEDIFAGRKRLKVYRQMKMYNDETMNPCIYNAKKTQPAA